LITFGFSRGSSPVTTNRPSVSELPLNITEDIIAYDGNPSVYFQNLNEPGTLFDVRFTPQEACSLVAVEVVTYLGSGPGIIHLFADSTGYPGGDLITPVDVSLWGNLQRQRIDLPSPIDVNLSDFHVALEYSQAPPPFMALDNNGGIGRSSYRSPGGDWTVFQSNDLNIRAYVNYYTSDNDPPEIESIPRVLGFSVEQSYGISAEITDLNGISMASVFYSIDSLNFTEISMTNVGGDTWYAEVPSQPVGTNVYYFISAVDNSPNQNMGMFPSGGPDDPLVIQIIEGFEISYDDGTPESFWIAGSVWDNNKFALRVTPDEYPVRITGTRIMVDEDTPFELTINRDNSGIPGMLIAGPFEASRNAEDWAILFIPEGHQPQIHQGDFWIIFHWRINSPESPGVGVDTFSPDFRSKRYTDSTGWLSVPSADFIMRVFGVSMISDIAENADGEIFPLGFTLLGNFPNPFNSMTEIRFLASISDYITLDIFDITGRKVKTPIDGVVQIGENKVVWDGVDGTGNSVSSGIYFYRLEAGNYCQTEKMVLIK
jgi:hypothetical protein